MSNRFLPRRVRILAMGIVVASVVLMQATDLFACSVCQGNPDSKLVQGAEAGVLFMVFVTYSLLLGMVGLGATWFVRQRRLIARSGGAVTADDADVSDDSHSA